MATVDEVFDQVMKLPAADRVRLVARVRQSVVSDQPDDCLTSEEWDAAWGEEIERRLEMVDRGEYDAKDWREMIEEIRRKHSRGNAS